jgi:hypothetical protein
VGDIRKKIQRVLTSTKSTHVPTSAFSFETMTKQTLKIYDTVIHGT